MHPLYETENVDNDTLEIETHYFDQIRCDKD